jgi:hypothetical protein
MERSRMPDHNSEQGKSSGSEERPPGDREGLKSQNVVWGEGEGELKTKRSPKALECRSRL